MLDCTTAYDLVFWFPAGDRAVGRSLRDAGEFSRVELDFIRACLEPDPTGRMIDVGANIGSICLPIAKAFPRVAVHAFEPHLPVQQVLATNCTINRLINVQILPWAVGDQVGMVQFPLLTLRHLANFGMVGRDTKSSGTIPTFQCRLDDLGFQDTRVIKIDVEGHDLGVLKGAVSLIRQQHPVVLFEGKPGEATSSAITLLRDLGYECYWLYVPFVTALNAKCLPVDTKTSWEGDINIVAVPKDRQPAWTLPRIGAPEEDWRSRTTELGYLQPYRNRAAE